MEKLQLYKFIHDNGIEYRYQYNYETKKDDLLIWIPFYLVEEFGELIESMSSDGGIDCTLTQNYLCFWMIDICSHFGIELEEIFEKENHE
jgi:NTP pyrophosphatase (non-canonical NTP hydrolase)